MEKEQILEIAKSKKVVVGEMEKLNTNKSCWISNIVVVILATILMIVMGAMGMFVGLYAIAFLCIAWESVFYFSQYFIAKRPWQVLIGAVLSVIGAIIMFVFFILYSVGVL